MLLTEKMDGMALLRNATEMAAMSKINHPNTVHIMAYFMDVVRFRGSCMGRGTMVEVESEASASLCQS